MPSLWQSTKNTCFWINGHKIYLSTDSLTLCERHVQFIRAYTHLVCVCGQIKCVLLYASIGRNECAVCVCIMCVIWRIYDVRSSLIQALHHHHHHGDFKLLLVLLSIHLISFFCCIPPSLSFGCCCCCRFCRSYSIRSSYSHAQMLAVIFPT